MIKVKDKGALGVRGLGGVNSAYCSPKCWDICCSTNFKLHALAVVPLWLKKKTRGEFCEGGKSRAAAESHHHQGRWWWWCCGGGQRGCGQIRMLLHSHAHAELKDWRSYESACGLWQPGGPGFEDADLWTIVFWGQGRYATKVRGWLPWLRCRVVTIWQQWCSQSFVKPVTVFSFHCSDRWGSKVQLCVIVLKKKHFNLFQF